MSAAAGGEGVLLPFFFLSKGKTLTGLGAGTEACLGTFTSGRGTAERRQAGERGAAEGGSRPCLHGGGRLGRGQPLWPCRNVAGKTVEGKEGSS